MTDFYDTPTYRDLKCVEEVAKEAETQHVGEKSGESHAVKRKIKKNSTERMLTMAIAAERGCIRVCINFPGLPQEITITQAA